MLCISSQRQLFACWYRQDGWLDENSVLLRYTLMFFSPGNNISALLTCQWWQVHLFTVSLSIHSSSVLFPPLLLSLKWARKFSAMKYIICYVILYIIRKKENDHAEIALFFLQCLVLL